MSKEKNLTRLSYVNKIPCTKDAECSNGVYYGPAIDRLHEFEKIGMEPEDLAKLKRMVENLDEKCTAQKGIILGLEKENEVLRYKADTSFNFGGVIHTGDHDYIQEFIDKLVKKNRELKEKSDPFHLTELCEALRKDVDRLKGEKIRSFETHTRVLVERDKLARENSELCDENSRLRNNMEQTKKIVDTADYEKEIEDLKGRLKKQTENGRYWHTEAMNSYRKYVNILDERAALQRKLADIEKIAKED